MLLAQALNVWAFLDVARSGARFLTKVVWTVILLVPGFGFIAWFLLGPRAA